MKDYEIKHMIIDEETGIQEYVTADFTHNNKEYSITFNKEDLEIINTWVFEKDTTLPANLSNDIIESIREEIKKKI